MELRGSVEVAWGEAGADWLPGSDGLPIQGGHEDRLGQFHHLPCWWNARFLLSMQGLDKAWGLGSSRQAWNPCVL